jgi:inorganic pyrophosphatase
MDLSRIPLGPKPPHEINIITEVPMGGEPVKYEFDKADPDDLEEVRGYIGKFYLEDYYEDDYLENLEDEYPEESSDSDYF